MSNTLMHDPVPDGRVGPFMRVPHVKLTGGLGYAFDPRCAGCIGERAAESTLFQLVGVGYATWTASNASVDAVYRAEIADRIEGHFRRHLDGTMHAVYEPVGSVTTFGTGMPDASFFNSVIDAGARP